jgi:hypothetical protein
VNLKRFERSETTFSLKESNNKVIKTHSENNDVSSSSNSTIESDETEENLETKK